MAELLVGVLLCCGLLLLEKFLVTEEVLFVCQGKIINATVSFGFGKHNDFWQSLV